MARNVKLMSEQSGLVHKVHRVNAPNLPLWAVERSRSSIDGQKEKRENLAALRAVLCVCRGDRAPL